MKGEKTTAAQWAAWLHGYGAEKFFEVFVKTAQDSESVCIHCGELIYLDIVEGGGVPDWKTASGDYGCPSSPDTGDNGTGGHAPEKLLILNSPSLGGD